MRVVNDKCVDTGWIGSFLGESMTNVLLVNDKCERSMTKVIWSMTNVTGQWQMWFGQWQMWFGQWQMWLVNDKCTVTFVIYMCHWPGLNYPKTKLKICDLRPWLSHPWSWLQWWWPEAAAQPPASPPWWPSWRPPPRRPTTVQSRRSTRCVNIRFQFQLFCKVRDFSGPWQSLWGQVTEERG